MESTECLASQSQLSARKEHIRRLTWFLTHRLNVTFWIGAAILVIVLVVAILADTIAPYAPTKIHPSRVLRAPSAEFILGTDDIGRDIFSRIVYGTRVTLMVVFLSIPPAACAGTLLGLVSGFFGGLTDAVIMRALDAALAFPVVLLAILIMGVLGPTLANTIIAIAVVYTPSFARVARAETLSIKEKEFVEASRSLGCSGSRLMIRVILPNMLSSITVVLTVSMATAILLEAGLSFLGLGIQPPEPSWGLMLRNGRGFMGMAPWFSIFPGLAIFLTVLGFQFVGDGIRDIADPRTRTGATK